MNVLFSTEETNHEESTVAMGILSDMDQPPLFPFSKADLEKITHIVKSVLTPVASALGLSGNLFALNVLRKESHSQKHNFNFYMRTLLITDLIFSFFIFLYTLPAIVENYDFYLANRMERSIDPVWIYFNKVLTHFSATLLIVMSMERLFALLRPLTFPDMFLFKHPRLVLFIALALFFVAMLPYPLCCRTEAILDNTNNTLLVMRERANWKPFMDPFVFSQTLLLYLVAPVIILIINFSIPIAYYRYTKSCASLIAADSKRREQQHKILAITVSIVVLFVLLSIPNMIGMTLDFVNADYSFFGKYAYVFKFLMNFGLFMTSVNKACNCVIYVLISNRFWLRFKGMCLVNCRRQSTRKRSSTRSSVYLSNKGLVPEQGFKWVLLLQKRRLFYIYSIQNRALSAVYVAVNAFRFFWLYIWCFSIENDIIVSSCAYERTIFWRKLFCYMFSVIYIFNVFQSLCFHSEI